MGLFCVASNAGDTEQFLMKKAIKRARISCYIQHYFTSKELRYKKPDTGYNLFLRFMTRNFEERK